MDGLAIDHVEEFDEIMAMVFGFAELDELGAQGFCVVETIGYF